MSVHLGVKSSHNTHEVGVDEPKETFPSIFLSKEHIDRLGLSSDDLGVEMVLTALVKVESFSVDERVDGESSKNASLAVTEAELSSPSSDSDKASKIFDGA